MAPLAVLLVRPGRGGTDPADPAGAPASTPAPEAPAPAPQIVIATTEGPLPPEDTAGLAVEPQLAALYAETGTLLTRGAVIERRVRLSLPATDAYGPHASAVTTQPHLALCLEFTDEDLDRYVAAIAPLTLLFAGASFDRWPELESFDICLVPQTDSDADPQPAITLIDVTREGYERWLAEGADLDTLLTLADERGSGVRVELSEAVRAAFEDGSMP